MSGMPICIGNGRRRRPPPGSARPSRPGRRRKPPGRRQAGLHGPRGRARRERLPVRLSQRLRDRRRAPIRSATDRARCGRSARRKRKRLRFGKTMEVPLRIPMPGIRRTARRIMPTPLPSSRRRKTRRVRRRVPEGDPAVNGTTRTDRIR